MSLKDQGPGWDPRRPRYTWTPPQWFQVVLTLAAAAAVILVIWVAR